jgi:hypothetical protein
MPGFANLNRLLLALGPPVMFLASSCACLEPHYDLLRRPGGRHLRKAFALGQGHLTQLVVA